MVNFIEYFYKIKIMNIKNEHDFYSFVYDNYVYKLYIYNIDCNTNYLLNVNKMLIGRTLVSEIVLNKDNQVISIYNNIPYILIKLYESNNKSITLEDINYLSNSLVCSNLVINWANLWSSKIDYLEELINEFGKKYPIMVDSFNYFVGMAENAISYYNGITIPNKYRFYISHKIIRYDDSSETLYNPLNIIFDYKVRDIAEYIKNAFWNNNYNVFNELNKYLNYNKLSVVDIQLLVSRLLYPSFYFNLYEDILINKKNEKIIIPFVNRLDEYEKYLAEVINYFNKYYDIDQIKWLMK